MEGAGYEIGSDGSGGNGPTSTVVAGRAPDVTAKMVREGDGGTLRLANVDPLPDGRVLAAGSNATAKSSRCRPCSPRPHGRASTTIADMEGVETVMVTTEPSGGTPAPTSAPIITMDVPQ